MIPSAHTRWQGVWWCWLILLSLSYDAIRCNAARFLIQQYGATSYMYVRAVCGRCCSTACSEYNKCFLSVDHNNSSCSTAAAVVEGIHRNCLLASDQKVCYLRPRHERIPIAGGGQPSAVRLKNELKIIIRTKTTAVRAFVHPILCRWDTHISYLESELSTMRPIQQTAVGGTKNSINECLGFRTSQQHRSNSNNSGG